MSTSRVFTAGQVLTAAQMNDLPQGLLAIQRGTSDVGPTSGTTELDIITAPAVTPAGTNRRIKVSFHCRGLTGTVAGDIFILRIKEGPTVYQESHYNVPGTSGSSATAIASDFSVIIDSPPASSHTYRVSIQRLAGTGTAICTGSATGPLHLQVEDVGI